MYLPQVLTQGTPSAKNLIDQLETIRPATLPDWVWKELFIIAVERLITKRQEVAAQTSASEALYMARHEGLEQDPDGEYHYNMTEYWTDMLKGARARKLGRGAPDKARRSMEPFVMWGDYRKLRWRLEAAKTPEERARALTRFWKNTGGSDHYPPALDEIVKRNRPSTAALEIVANRYGYSSPDNLQKILNRAGFSLESEIVPEGYGELKTSS